MDSVMELAARHNLFVVEDAAQALGSEYTFASGEVKKAGTIGTIGCTSFFPSKNLGCFGDGGALFTDDPLLAERMRAMTHHGSKVKYYHDSLGMNSRLDTLQAAVLDVKLKYLDGYNEARAKAAKYYDDALSGIDRLKLPKRMKSSTHIFHTYTLRLDPAERDSFRNFLKTHGVPTMVYYPVPMHLQKAYTDYGYKPGDMPVSEELCTSVLSIPMHTELTPEQLGYICDTIHTYFKNS
jgi:UDP-2-acetamido-2-deoxy-ribo-hexuluronate aminotransferase